MCKSSVLVVFWLRNTHPTQVPSGATNTAWASIGAGYYHTCAARLDDGTAECWGDNSNNEIVPPVSVSFSVISGGVNFTCGISRDTGYPVCFGANSNRVSVTPNLALGKTTTQSSTDHRTAAVAVDGRVEPLDAGAGGGRAFGAVFPA